MIKAPWKFSVALLLGLPVAGLAIGCGGEPVPEETAVVNTTEGPQTTTQVAANPTTPTPPGGGGEVAGAGSTTPNGLTPTPPERTSSAVPQPTPAVATPPATTAKTAAPAVPPPPTAVASIAHPASVTKVAEAEAAHDQSVGGAPNAAGGTIHGKVVWEGDPPRIEAIHPARNPNPTVCGAKEPMPDNALVVDPSTKGVAYVVAYLNRPTGAAKTPPPSQTVVLDQKNCVFVPHVVGVQTNQKLEFASQDPVNHNIHTNPFRNSSTNFILNGGAKRDITFPRPESFPVKVTCDIHPWMNSYVLVADNPYFAVTGKDGSFEIKGVPAGTQHLVLWMDKGYLKGYAKPGKAVTVTKGETTDLGPVSIQASDFKR